VAIHWKGAGMKRLTLGAIGLALAVMLGACASGPRQLYEGARRTPAEESLLAVASALEVIRIDDDRFPAFFASGDKKLALLPGDHAVVVRFNDNYTSEGGLDERVTSAAYVLELELAPGGRYRLDARRPDTLADAREFAASPTISFVDLETDEGRELDLEGKGRSVTDAMLAASAGQEREGRGEQALDEPAQEVTSSTTTPAEAIAMPPLRSDQAATDTRDAEPSAGATATTAHRSQALAQLEVWWGRASKADRERFLEQVRPAATASDDR